MSIGVNFCEIFNHCIGATPSFSAGGVNQMWILQEIYKDLLHFLRENIIRSENLAEKIRCRSYALTRGLFVAKSTSF
jgi:hypothetical protein